MAHLLGGAVGQPRRPSMPSVGTCQTSYLSLSSTAASSFVQPATPNGGFCGLVWSDSLSMKEVGSGLRDVRDRARGEVDRPVLVALDEQQVLPGWPGLHEAVVDGRFAPGCVRRSSRPPARGRRPAGRSSGSSRTSTTRRRRRATTGESASPARVRDPCRAARARRSRGATRRAGCGGGPTGASIFCLGITTTSFACQTSTVDGFVGAGGSAPVAAARRIGSLSSHFAMPRNSDASVVRPGEAAGRRPSACRREAPCRRRDRRRAAVRPPEARSRRARRRSTRPSCRRSSRAERPGRRRPSARRGRCRSTAEESSTRSTPLAGSKSCTPLPVLPVALMTSASRWPRSASCQANCETLPNVVSRPVARSRTMSVVPGRSSAAAGVAGTAAATAACPRAARRRRARRRADGAYGRIARHAPSGLKANDSIASIVTASARGEIQQAQLVLDGLLLAPELLLLRLGLRRWL